MARKVVETTEYFYNDKGELVKKVHTIEEFNDGKHTGASTSISISDGNKYIINPNESQTVTIDTSHILAGGAGISNKDLKDIKKEEKTGESKIMAGTIKAEDIKLARGVPQESQGKLDEASILMEKLGKDIDKIVEAVLKKLEKDLRERGFRP